MMQEQTSPPLEGVFFKEWEKCSRKCDSGYIFKLLNACCDDW